MLTLPKSTLLFFSNYLRMQNLLRVFAALILLSQCSEPPPAEQQILAQLERAKTSIEKLEAAELRDVLADEFEVLGDNKPYDYERIKKTMLVFGLRKQKINIILSATTVTLDPYNSQLASLESNVLITGSRGLLPDDGRLYRIESQWRLFNDEWKITRLSWK